VTVGFKRKNSGAQKEGDRKNFQITRHGCKVGISSLPDKREDYFSVVLSFLVNGSGLASRIGIKLDPILSTMKIWFMNC